jgi:integrase
VVYKRGKSEKPTYWYKFTWRVKGASGDVSTFTIRRSARTSNKRHAIEARDEHRRALRLGEIHPLDPWPTPPQPKAPVFRAYCNTFLEFSKLHVKAGSLVFYQTCIKRLLANRELASASLDQIRGELLSRYVKGQVSAGVSVSTINGNLRTLRRMLRLAYEWELIGKVPVIHEVPGKQVRTRVISHEEEARYLAAASRNLRSLAILAADTGLRPNSELFRLEWSAVDLEGTEQVPYGSIRVHEGKTSNATRVIPLTPRGHDALNRQRKLNLHYRWVFPGPSKASHVVTIQQSHRKALRLAGIEHFPFYTWRHTFGTRCAESGMDRFTLAKLMGHSSPRITERYYIHVTEPHVALGFERFLAYQASKTSVANPSIQ